MSSYDESRLRCFINDYLESTKECDDTPDSLSEQRIHKLIYFTELFLYRNQYEPLRIDFQPYIEGIFSDEIHKTIARMDNIKKRPVHVRGKDLVKCEIENNGDSQDFVEYEANIATDVFENCNANKLSSSEIMDAIRATPPFSGTNYGEDMNLRKHLPDEQDSE